MIFEYSLSYNICACTTHAMKEANQLHLFILFSIYLSALPMDACFIIYTRCRRKQNIFRGLNRGESRACSPQKNIAF